MAARAGTRDGRSHPAAVEVGAQGDLSHEAIRLTRAVHEILPDDAEVTGLLALMLLTDARRPARTGPDGELIPLDEQDRGLWNRDAIAEGIALVTDALPRGAVGPYQVRRPLRARQAERLLERGDERAGARVAGGAGL